MAMVFGFWLLNNYNNFGNKSRGNMRWKQKFIQNIYVLLFTFYLYEACSTYFEIRPSLELHNNVIMEKCSKFYFCYKFTVWLCLLVFLDCPKHIIWVENQTTLIQGFILWKLFSWQLQCQLQPHQELQIQLKKLTLETILLASARSLIFNYSKI